MLYFPAPLEHHHVCVFESASHISGMQIYGHMALTS
jgi:hypothetical protein